MLLILLACKQDENFDFDFDVKSSGIADITIDFGETGADIYLNSPVYKVPPYSEIEICLFMNYTGEDMYYYKGISYQDPNFGHHSDIDVGQLGEAYDLRDVGDSCEQAMELPWNPIAVPGYVTSPGVIFGEYPENSGYLVTSNTTFMLQSHYINYTDEPILVNSRFDIFLKDPAEIEKNAAPFEVGDSEIVIPEGFHENVFNCTMEQDVTLSWIMGHMHEYGAYQHIDWISNGVEERIYSENWIPDYYMAAPINEFNPPLEIKTGDILRVTCAWNNTTGGTIAHPTEMCYAQGIIFNDEAISCD